MSILVFYVLSTLTQQNMRTYFFFNWWLAFLCLSFQSLWTDGLCGGLEDGMTEQTNTVRELNDTHG